jgi:uncharacterized membrane protein YccF (DUF307 family)
MATLGNILWFVLGGFLIAFGYLVGGVLLCLTIVGIPFGVQAFKLARAVAAPFGLKVVEREGASGCVAVVLNLIWILLPGLELALAHLLLAVVLGVTIVGLPFARQHVKLVPLALMPFGRTLVADTES